MENLFAFRIQLISIVISILFLIYVSRLIIKGKLREEFAIFWISITAILIIFSFWRNGLDVVAQLVGIYLPPNLVFMGAILAIFLYLLHLSTMVSRLHEENKRLTQKMAILEYEKKKENQESENKEHDDKA